MQQVGFTPDGRQQVAYAAMGQPGIPPQQQPQQPPQMQMPMQVNGYGGEPTMRESVEGIPQVHFQQQPGMPMAAQMPQSFMPAAQYTVPAQAYPTYYPAMGPQPGFPQMVTHVANYRFGAPMGGEWEEDFDETGGAVLYGNLEVKHRRRTTPEQLRVLEHWFNINPRPDNQVREWLAGQLGITKRNVQVWFQNRRAKIKNQEKAREAAEKEAAAKAEAATTASTETGKSEDEDKKSESKPPTPPVAQGTEPADRPNQQLPQPPQQQPQQQQQQPQQQQQQPHQQQQQPQQQQLQPQQQQMPPPPQPLVQQPQQPPQQPLPSPQQQPHVPSSTLLPSPDKLNMGRRVSLAGGESANAVALQAKRFSATTPHSPGGHNSPLGLAAAARRNSQPYPTQIITQHEEGLGAARPLASPKVSPNNNRMPPALLFTAMRNNTLRRASMPGGAQLMSTTVFAPPRVGNVNNFSEANTSPTTASTLTPIKDQESQDVPVTFVTPPTDSFLHVPNDSYLNPGMPFAPNSPLPNPSFSFGTTPSSDSVPTSASSTPVGDDPQSIFMALQRGRLGSIASKGGSDLEPWQYTPDGFDPDIRRASAPADLLKNIGMLGISHPSGVSSASHLTRPSPLAAAQYQPGGLDSVNYELPPQHQQHPNGAMGGGPYIPAPDSSYSSGASNDTDSPSRMMPPPSQIPNHHFPFPNHDHPNIPEPLPEHNPQQQQQYTQTAGDCSEFFDDQAYANFINGTGDYEPNKNNV